LPKVDVLCRLHDGLGVEFGELFQGRRFSRLGPGSRTVNREGGGIRHETSLGEYQLLSGELSKKAFQPMLVRVPKGEQEPILNSHAGEEFLYVVRGALRFYMEPYSGILLETGESVHFDATMPHGVTAAGEEDALFLALCQSANSSDGMLEKPRTRLSDNQRRPSREPRNIDRGQGLSDSRNGPRQFDARDG